MTLQETMEALYASEINCRVSSFWDGGWEIALGDEMNGYRAVITVTNLSIAPEWMT